MWVPPITIWWVTYIFGWGKFGFGLSNLKYLVLILTHQMNIGQVKNKYMCLYPFYSLNEKIYLLIYTHREMKLGSIMD